jgi:hypothetical protein
MEDEGVTVRFLADAIDSSLFRMIPTGSVSHPASYQMGDVGYFTGHKVAEA